MAILCLSLAYFLVVPALALYACHKVRFFDRIGAVILCYLAGVFGSYISSYILFDTSMTVLTGFKEDVMSICVALALPLMLFSSDIKSWLQLAPRTLVAMFSAIVAVVFCSYIAGALWQNDIDSISKIVGLNIALYVGGTPNLAAVKDALEVDNNIFLQLHLYDTLVSAGYLLFVTSIAQRLFLLWLPPFKFTANPGNDTGSITQESKHNYSKLLNRVALSALVPAVILAIAIVGGSVAFAALFPSSVKMSAIMIALTLLGLGASLSKPIRNIPHSFELGMYIILVFCVVVGSMINGDLIPSLDTNMLAFVMFVVFGSLLIHAAVCALMRIDVDTFLVTSVATICSPPFVPMLAVALNNQQLLLSGMTAGVIGYALGGVLGIGLSQLFGFLM
ncbi:hypothetical protein A9Q81_03905 [Gammaproteobacteria bacterium 42_54_T18]|nr:hypothetical protein A9Q81_03905 [Gammaproteobacteria bacterium 42_54_T18]